MVLAGVGVVLAVLACIAFTRGQNILLRLPGDIPRLDQLPTDGSADAAVRWMWVALAGIVAGLLSEVAAGVLGWKAQRDGDTRGIWALVTAIGWPMLVVLTIGGIAAR